MSFGMIDDMDVFVNIQGQMLEKHEYSTPTSINNVNNNVMNNVNQ